MKIKKYWGTAGTGKTTKLLNIIRELKQNYNIEKDICFCTFSKVMSEHFLQRLYQDVLEIPFNKEESRKRFEFYATIHGVCNRLVFENEQLRPAENHKSKWCELIGIDYNSDGSSKCEGNIFFDTKSWITNTKGKEEDCKRFETKEPLTVENYRYLKSRWEEYKTENNLLDFDDMLLYTIKYELTPPSKVLMVDEFQDLSPLQYDIYCMWRDKMEEVYIVGDPNQSIYDFQGCTPRFFNDEKAEMEVLPKTYRLGEVSWSYAKKVLKNAELDVPDVVADFKDDNVMFIDEDELTSFIRPSVKTFVITHTNDMAYDLGKYLKGAGIIFSGKRSGGWGDNMKAVYNSIYLLTRVNPSIYILPDQFRIFLGSLRKEYLVPGMKKKDINDLALPSRVYYKDAIEFLNPFFRSWGLPFDFSVLTGKWIDNEKEDLGKETRGVIINNALMNSRNGIIIGSGVYVGTIHSIKGSEAEDVFLYDQVSWSCHHHNDEGVKGCLFFVGVTRHRQNLYIVRGSGETTYTYELPEVT